MSQPCYLLAVSELPLYKGREGYVSSLVSESSFGPQPLLAYHCKKKKTKKQGRQLIGRIWG